MPCYAQHVKHHIYTYVPYIHHHIYTTTYTPHVHHIYTTYHVDITSSSAHQSPPHPVIHTHTPPPPHPHTPPAHKHTHSLQQLDPTAASQQLPPLVHALIPLLIADHEGVRRAAADHLHTVLRTCVTEDLVLQAVHVVEVGVWWGGVSGSGKMGRFVVGEC